MQDLTPCLTLAYSLLTCLISPCSIGSRGTKIPLFALFRWLEEKKKKKHTTKHHRLVCCRVFGGGQLVWEALGNFQLGPKSSIANSGPICLISSVLGRVWFWSAPSIHPQEEPS